jgi:uncharacterized protein
MDVTPLIPADRQVIDSYSAHGFRVSGVAHIGAIIVFPDRTLAWHVTAMADIDAESLAAVIFRGQQREVEILLLGCGAQMQAIPNELRKTLRGAGIVTDPMDTRAACRTYNILLAEERRIAAALLPLDSSP